MRGRVRVALVLAAAATGCFQLDADGDGWIDAPPSLGDEGDPIACADGRDNDQDGLVDCRDGDCLMGGHCGERIPLLEPSGHEDDPAACTNGIDDDEDGTFDCGDAACRAIRELCCLTEVDDEACSDRRDNDGNGFADCADRSCRQGPFVTVCDAEGVCDDGLDDDGDGATDCADPDCRCGCGPGCAGPEGDAHRCTDGADNDGDGFVDCDDFDCARSPDATVAGLCRASADGVGGAEGTAAACADGIDNDGDGFVDCADFGCSRPAIDHPDHDALQALCVAEDTFEACADGADNDGDGYADCEDFSCRSVPVERVCVGRDGGLAARSDVGCPDGVCRRHERCVSRQPCRESDPTSEEAAVRSCTDGLDNDGDGFTDCDDWDCNHDPLVRAPVVVGSRVELRPLCRDPVDGRPRVCP
ncbi:MAG: hypothetical protein ACFCGT_08125 [Sandaracinaceae bacterium]